MLSLNGVLLFRIHLPQGLGTGLLFTDNVEMPLEIRKDCLWFCNDDIRPTKTTFVAGGKGYTPGDIHSLVAEGEGNHPSAIWDLYLFLKRMGLMMIL